jgi:hypothetical protein
VYSAISSKLGIATNGISVSLCPTIGELGTGASTAIFQISAKVSNSLSGIAVFR